MEKMSKREMLLNPSPLHIPVSYLSVINAEVLCDWRSDREIPPPKKDEPDKALAIIREHCKVERNFIKSALEARDVDDWMDVRGSYSFRGKRNDFHQNLAAVVNINPRQENHHAKLCWICSLIRAMRFYYLFNLHKHLGYDPASRRSSAKNEKLSVYFAPIHELLTNSDTGRWMSSELSIVKDKLAHFERKSGNVRRAQHDYTVHTLNFGFYSTEVRIIRLIRFLRG